MDMNSLHNQTTVNVQEKSALLWSIAELSGIN